MPHIGHWRYDPVRDEVSWDAGMASIFGLSADRLPRRVADVVALVHPADRDRIVRHGEQAPEHEPLRRQYRTVRPDGTEIWIADEAWRDGDHVTGTAFGLGSSAQAIERYAVLLDAGHALEGARTRDEALQALVRLIARRLGDLAFAGVLEEGGPRVAAFDAVDEAHREALRAALRAPAWDADGGIAQVMRTGEALLVPPADEAFLRSRVAGGSEADAAATFVGHGFAIVPLLDRGDVVGALVQGRAGVLGEADLGVLQDLGRRAGMALRALGRLEREQGLRRAAEEARTMLDQLVEAAPIGVAFFDRELRYQRVNAALEALNGMPADAHHGRRPSEVLPVAGADVEAALAHVLRTGEVFADEVTVPVPDAPTEQRSFQVGLYRVGLADEAPLGVGATVFELTDRKATEAALQAQRDRYARLLEAQDLLGEGVFVLGLDGFEWLNAAACEIAGRSLEDMLALESVLELIRPEHRQLMAERLLEVLTGEQAVRFDVQLRRPDGSDVWVELAGRSLTTGGTTRVIGVGRDIDERKQAELERDSTHRRTALLADVAGLLEASLDLRALLGGAARLLVERGLCDACAFDVGGAGGWRRIAVAPERADLEGEVEHPLVSGGRTVGRMVVDGARDEALTAELAARVAPVVVNAQLYEERVRVARVLQESLLPPQLPAVPGITVATRYAPGAARLDVGGDFYDLFAGGPGVWNAVVGDVCGKGAEAAALTALARHTLRALADASSNPAELLRALNAAILREGLPGERFISMVVARLVPHDGTGLQLEVACAGHPPPLVARAGRPVEEVGCGGTLLGVGAASTYRSARLDLGSGDLAVLYTDGLTEAARGTTDRTYLEVPARLREEGPEAVAAGLEAWAVDQRGGGEANDDLALLVIGA